MRSTNAWFRRVRFRMAIIYALSVAIVSGVIFLGVYGVELHTATHHEAFAQNDVHHHQVVEYHVTQIGQLLMMAWFVLLALSVLVGYFFAPYITRAAEEAMENLSRAADAIAHDLKTPLARLRLRSEMAAAEEGPEAAFAMEVAADTTSMLSLVNTLLEIARLERTGFACEETVDLCELVREVEDLYRPVAENAGLKLSVTLPEGPHCVKAHHGKLMQVIGNLVDNAVKYTPEGGAVGIALEERNGELALAVSDTGIGIPRESQGHLFEKFYRAENAVASGNGLGLALVKAIVEACGGRITVVSEAGKGSTFTVYLTKW